jgi:hypothetical protein
MCIVSFLKEFLIPSRFGKHQLYGFSGEEETFYMTSRRTRLPGGLVLCYTYSDESIPFGWHGIAMRGHVFPF